MKEGKFTGIKVEAGGGSKRPETLRKVLGNSGRGRHSIGEAITRS